MSPRFISGCEMSGHAVHLDRHAHAVPVNGRRLRQIVGEVHDQAVADAGADERSGNAAVVGPGAHALPGCHFDVGDARGQVDLDDLRIGIRVAGLGEPEAGIPIRRRKRGRRPSGGDAGTQLPTYRRKSALASCERRNISATLWKISQATIAVAMFSRLSVLRPSPTQDWSHRIHSSSIVECRQRAYDRRHTAAAAPLRPRVRR